MKVRKAIKAIAALGAGISMVGATIMGAMAQDLSEYPAPFVQNGGFDGLIVVGDQAAAEDIVGAIDIGISLQYAVRQQASVSAGAAAVTISEGKKIDKTGNHLNYGDNLSDIIEVLDDEDLPVILADGRYQDSEGETSNDETYEQTLRLYDDGGKLVFAADDDGEELADNYLFFNDG
ncbi:S-layer protein, partial [Candidatus Woesearchaeota archaeon]|nr:S-layer protein [Candidatus Woesearchaeota archaeon]